MKALGGDFEWSPEMHMMANIELGVRYILWAIQVTNSPKNSETPPKPERLQPPSKAIKKPVDLAKLNKEIEELNELLGI